MAGDVYGYFTLAPSNTSCDHSAWMSAATSAASTAGVDLASYTNVMLAFPHQSACWWAGLANLIGRTSFINGYLTPYVTAHELGHNFGVYHASSLRCVDASGARVSLSTDCTLGEYGDPFDVMGSNAHHTSNWHRRQLGFLTRADEATVTAPGTYRLATAEVAGGTPRILRIARPNGDFFYLEWRQPYGRFDAFATTAAAVRGVIIRIAPDTRRGRSKLIDTTPETTSWLDAPLVKGRTFVDPTNGISITTTELDANGATVQIGFGPVRTPSPTLVAAPTSTPIVTPRPTVAPSATVAPSPTRTPAPTASPSPVPTPTALPDRVPPTTPQNVSLTVTDKNKVQLTWLASADNAGGVTYQIYRDGTLMRTTSVTSQFLTVSPGAHSFVVRALDIAGNASGFSNRVAVLISDWRGSR
jgi:hypothetical protein